ncbi:MAG: hypothetical protein WD004_08210 [Actinomycetota bacterium]
MRSLVLALIAVVIIAGLVATLYFLTRQGEACTIPSPGLPEVCREHG